MDSISKGQAILDAMTWETPRPIEAQLPPVKPFNAAALLPEVLQQWAADEADRMPCPTDFIGAGALVSAGSIIGARCAIKPKARDDWQVVPNVWGGIVAPPSVKKSPALAAAMKHLDRLAHFAAEDHEKKAKEYEVKRIVYEAQSDALKNKIKSAARGEEVSSVDVHAKELQDLDNNREPEPILRRYKTNDTTVEKLGEILRDNPAGILVVRDELVGLLSSWDREGREGDRAFFLEAWNGNVSFDTDRIGRGSVHIPNLCVSIFGGLTPDKLTNYLEQAANSLANDGMLQRFQFLVFPDTTKWEYRDRVPNKDARDKAFDVFRQLSTFDPVEWGAEPVDAFTKFPFFKFGPAAQEIYIEWAVELHRIKITTEEHPIIAQHLAKYDKLFPAIALILHLIECAATGSKGPVSERAAIQAGAWCEYLESHARRCYGLLVDDGLRAARALADRVRRGNLEDGFTARDVYRRQWHYLSKRESVEAALDWLEDEKWLMSEETGGTGQGSGRRTFRYWINPKIQKKAPQGTANTDVIPLTSVMAVPQPAVPGSMGAALG